jgi:death on curing protein
MLPLFLDIERTLRTHRSLLDHYGGAPGVRDIGLLHSAIAMPQASFGGEFLHRDLFEMAAAYLFHIVQNHPFLDGNKRTGAAAAIIFLAMNGIEIEADEDGLVELTLAVAEGQAGKREIAEFFKSKAHPPSPPKAE